MNNKNENKLLSFFLLTVFVSFSFMGGFNSGVNSIGKEKAIWPTEKTKNISSTFGYRQDPFGSGKAFFHNGLDIPAPPGENVIALEDGEVTKSEFYGGYGHTVCFKGKTTKLIYLYGHLDDNYLVKVGKKVKKGDIIGKVGKTNVYGVPNNPYKDFKGNPTNGNTTGPHLHFSIIKDGKFIDPMFFLNKLKKHM